jgi:hypothetical protein
MATKALDKHQCLVRLDDTEIEKLAAIQSELGLNKTGAIRRLIREFNLGSGDDKPANKFIVGGQISKNIFLQLPIREIHVDISSITLSEDGVEDSGEIITSVDYEIDDRFNILGFVYYPSLIKPSMREFYQHDILYLFDSRMYRSIAFSQHPGEKPLTGKYYDKLIAEYRETESHLQQIFVV